MATAAELLAEINRRASLSGKLEGDSDYAQGECDRYNTAKGYLEGDDCPECLNKGRIARKTYEPLYGEYIMTLFPCRCMAGRISKQRLLASGAGAMLQRCTFDTYEARTDWQRNVKSSAEAYVGLVRDGLWYYIGGDVGAGKSHICAAIMQELIKQGFSVRWMDWAEEATRIRMGWRTEYEKSMEPWKTAQVLVVDDFLKAVKTERSKRPEREDVKLAYSIINHRYKNPALITILSSEFELADIEQFDEALSSRIEQRCTGDFVISVASGLAEISRNQRPIYGARGDAYE